ncbi:hypothetical protein C3L33_13936, partial [Rhododendron williamsianum]
MALALSMSPARLNFLEMKKMNIGVFEPSSSSSAKGRSLQPLHCTPLQQIEHQQISKMCQGFLSGEHGAIAVDSYVISENVVDDCLGPLGVEVKSQTLKRDKLYYLVYILTQLDQQASDY